MNLAKEKRSVRNLLVLSVLLFSFQPVFSIDTDMDGLTDEDERKYYTDPNNPDTDGDGYFDGLEIQKDYSPHLGNGARLNEHDFDNDGLNDWLERWFGSDIGQTDTDGDSFSDFDEVMYGFDPKDGFPERKFDRKIQVDRTHQRLYYYSDGVKIMNLAVSTGNPETETPDGEFSIFNKIENKTYSGIDYNLENVLWNMEFLPMYYIHGAYWHNSFGTRTYSHGCVNLRNEDAEKLYKYTEMGTPVTVTGTTPSEYFIQI